MTEKKTILVTGSSGFIGSNLCIRLLNDYDYRVIGIDNHNDYYDVNLKEYRLDKIRKLNKDFIFIKGDILINLLLIRYLVIIRLMLLLILQLKLVLDIR